MGLSLSGHEYLWQVGTQTYDVYQISSTSSSPEAWGMIQYLYLQERNSDISPITRYHKYVTGKTWKNLEKLCKNHVVTPFPARPGPKLSPQSPPAAHLLQETLRLTPHQPIQQPASGKSDWFRQRPSEGQKDIAWLCWIILDNAGAYWIILPLSCKSLEKTWRLSSAIQMQQLVWKMSPSMHHG